MRLRWLGRSKTLRPEALAAVTVVLLLTVPASVDAQRGQGPPAAPPTSEPSWQGESVAEWRYTAVPPRNGELKVVTDRIRAGYIRKNGVPYSANATLTEYYHRMSVPTGDLWLTIVTEVTDPENLRVPFVLSTHFKKLPDGAAFTPEACSAS